MPRKKTLDEIIFDFKKAHGNKYDYSEVVYVNCSTKVIVICPEHGRFSITPNHHAKGVGCRQCYHESQKITLVVFKERAAQYFDQHYDYSFVPPMPLTHKKIKIFCKTHNRFFFQNPRNHILGHTGCPECIASKFFDRTCRGSKIKSNSEMIQRFEERAKLVHGAKYRYDEFFPLDNTKKGKIVCPTHGEFWQTQSNHLRGSSCPHCAKKLKFAGSFKEKCAKLSVNYWRALKRRQAGLDDSHIFDKGKLVGTRSTEEIIVYGQKFSNLAAAIREYDPPASSTTIRRLIKSGLSPDDAFRYIPNPGYTNGIIYLIVHSSSQKQYVGLTTQTIERRWEDHISQANLGNIKNKHSLHAAIRNSGASAFSIAIIDHGTTKHDLEEKEKFWINMLNTRIPYGYNISRGGVSGGSNTKTVTLDGKKFKSAKSAAKYVAEKQNISFAAAKRRVSKNRINVKKRATTGNSLVKGKCYKAWSYIKHCVLNSNSKSYDHGVSLFESWSSDFMCFYRDVGEPAESNMVFARIDKDKGYFPGNCVWMTRKQLGLLRRMSSK